MDLTVLGAGPAYTDRPGATGASYLVRAADTAVLLDLGQGSFPRLAAELEPSGLAAIVVSHLHPDHFIDLVSLRHYLRYQFAPPRRIRVLAPAGLAGRLDALHSHVGFAAETLDVEPLLEGPLTIGGLELETRRVTHTADSHAFRIAAVGDDRPGLVYSGDCGVASDLTPLIRPGDALLVEVSFGPGPVSAGALHLDGPAVGRLAAATSPGRVLLTHLQMGFDEAATIASVSATYDGDVQFVWPGTRLTI